MQEREEEEEGGAQETIISRGALDDLNRIFMELADGQYENVKYDLKAHKMLPAAPTAPDDTDAWTEPVSVEADWGALLEVES